MLSAAVAQFESLQKKGGSQGLAALRCSILQSWGIYLTRRFSIIIAWHSWHSILIVSLPAQRRGVLACSKYLKVQM